MVVKRARMMFDRFVNRARPAQRPEGNQNPSANPADAAQQPSATAADGTPAPEGTATSASPAASRGEAGVAPLPRYDLGQVVRHRIFPFRGVIFDVDPQFANSEEWWEAIPEAIRPAKNQPFYHLLAENGEGAYVAYVSQQNLLPDETGQPVSHPAVSEMFEGFDGECYRLQRRYAQ